MSFLKVDRAETVSVLAGLYFRKSVPERGHFAEVIGIGHVAVPHAFISMP